jgi:hypothetical protein
MIRESDIQERLNRNREILQEAEQDRLARLASNQETRPNLIRRALAYLGKGLVWLGTRMQALYDCKNLGISDQPC